MSKKTIRCAFCQGKGRDPFEVPSLKSVCQVCHGQGIIYFKGDGKECQFCHGSGKHPTERLTCPVCRGWGVLR